MNYSLIMSLILTVSSCQNNILPEKKILPAQTLLNVAYGTDSMQKMDVYLPAKRNASTKVLFLIHGGAWSGGDKADFSVAIEAFKKYLPHYAMVNINYRLAKQTGNYFPTQENDVQSAVNFIYKKGNLYSVSNDFVIMGASAGAHLALLHAYKYKDPVQVKAIVSFFGPADLDAMYRTQANAYYKSLFALLVGGTPSANSAAYTRSSPINYVDSKSPPTLLLHGARDIMVDISQSKTLKAKLELNRVPNELIIYPNEGHGWRGTELDNSFRKVARFLEEHVR
jgi:acetyl esterase/lipase